MSTGFNKQDFRINSGITEISILVGCDATSMGYWCPVS